MADSDSLGVDFDFYASGGGLDLTPTISTTTNGRRVVIGNLARRLEMKRGHFLDAPDVGFDLWSELGASSTGVASPAIKQGIEEQALLDERITFAEATVTVDATGESYQILTRLADADGPFTFVLGVSALGVELLSNNP